MHTDEFTALVSAIVADDEAEVSRLLATAPELALVTADVGATRQAATNAFFTAIDHYIYAGDTALHMAAASFRVPFVRDLIRLGADVDARNRRGAAPLHYAVDGIPGSRNWNPDAQRQVVVLLLNAGADPNATDKGGVTPLHRAVRNRCSSAVDALLGGGADPRRTNKSGSTPLKLAGWTTGRGGSGSEEATAEQRVIIGLLEAALAT